MKKIISLLLAISLVVGVNCFSASAKQDEQYSTATFKMGDVNKDNSVDLVDCLNTINVLLNKTPNGFCYEYADLNGDFEVNAKDVLSMRKLLAQREVEISNNVFSAPDKDITNELFDLGINNEFSWNNSESKYILSRNPYDMITHNDVVLVSGGNYDDNTGPVNIRGYSRFSDTPRLAGQLDSEQVNRFYKYDEMAFATSIDSRYWGAASIYVAKKNSFFLNTKANVLIEDIHCYDMAYYNDSYFYAGSGVHYDSKYKNYSRKDVEMSKGIVYRFTGSDITKATANDFKEVELVNKNNEVIKYESTIQKYTTTTANPPFDYYITTGVPRIYDLFEIKGELFAFYYDPYTYLKNSKFDFAGLYKYDCEKDQFIYNTDYNFDGLVNLYKISSRNDGEKINHDFVFNNTHYFIADDLYYTNDYKTYSNFSIPNYSAYFVKDVIVRNGEAFLLVTKQNASNKFTNYVLKTKDFKTFTPVLHFSSKAFARSFEYCSGAFFFGLGCYSPEYSTECGRIYRYIYYK
ncbi:MAG: hypothetical protein IIU65_04460 [Clostridia bacterium]|nr:hypothetical protein [Clostridia bacterium]